MSLCGIFLGGVFMYGEGGNPFPHDGEHGADCTGYGSCDCDEKNYGYRGGGLSGGSSGDTSGCLIVAALIVASIVAYSISEILGTILLIVYVIGILCTR